MNLHLYIAEHSAHPPGALKGLVSGLLRRYYTQNTEFSNFKLMTRKLFSRLIDCGYSSDTLRPLFNQVYTNITAPRKSFSITLNDLDPLAQELLVPASQSQSALNLEKEMASRLFLHLQYHPRDISRRRIQNLFHSICMKRTGHEGKTFCQNPEGKSLLDINRVTVAYSRPKNLQDLVAPSTFFKPEGFSIKDTWATHLHQNR